MKSNKVDYFEKCIKLLRELKKDHPDVEVSKHYSLATDCGSFSLTDRELFYELNKHKNELDMNTLPDEDMEKVLLDTEELFREVESDDEDEQEDGSFAEYQQ